MAESDIINDAHRARMEGRGPGGPGAGSGVIVSVRTFGAKGDGAANDTAALQAAINAARAAGGGTVHIPASTGPYRHTGLTVYSGVTLAGDGMSPLGGGGSELRLVGDTAHAIYGANITYLTIRDLVISGAAPGTSLGSYDGIYLDKTGSTATQNIAVENVKLSGFSRHGFHAEDLAASVLRNVRAQNVGGNGFWIDAGKAVTFAGCRASACLTGGYRLSTVLSSTLTGCTCDASGLGYLLETCRQTSLVSCGVETPLAAAASFRLTAGTGNTLLGCYSTGNRDVAFDVASAETKAHLINCREASPIGATNSFRVAAGCTATILGHQATTASSLAAGTTYRLTDGVATMPNAVTVPTANPAAGGTMYVEGGVLKWRDVGGVVTVLAPANGVSRVTGITDSRSLSTVAALFPQSKRQRVFIGGGVRNTPASLIAAIDNYCGALWTAGFVPILGWKMDPTQVAAGQWDAYIAEAGAYLLTQYAAGKRSEVVIWHEPEADWFTGGTQPAGGFPAYFNKVATVLRGVSGWSADKIPIIFTSMAYQWLPGSSNGTIAGRTSNDGADWQGVDADFFCTDIYHGSSRPLTEALKDHPGFQRWQTHVVNAGSTKRRWGVTERGWLVTPGDTANYTVRANQINAELAWLLSDPVGRSCEYWMYWNTVGQESNPALVIDTGVGEPVLAAALTTLAQSPAIRAA